MRLSVVVACHNDQSALRPLYDELTAAVAPRVAVLEMIFVDDASTDATRDTLLALAGDDVRVRLVSVSGGDGGTEAALVAGARQAAGDAVVLLPAGPPHPPGTIARMLQEFDEDVDQVIAAPTRAHGRAELRLLRRRAVDAVIARTERDTSSGDLFDQLGPERRILSGEHAVRRRWTDHLTSVTSRAVALPATILAVTYAISALAMLLTKPQYSPDSQYYTGMALRFSGMSAADAYAQVVERSAQHGWHAPTIDTIFGWGLVQPRVVYPGLSAPFVKAFGVDGMVIVPVIAMAVFVGLTFFVLRTRYRTLAVIAPVLLVVVSPQLIFFGTAMLTESLTALWCAAILFSVWRYHEVADRRWLIAAGAFTIVMAFTRQAALIPAGAMAMAWLGAVVVRRPARQWGWSALVVGASAVASQIAQSVLWPSFSQVSQFITTTGADDLPGALRATPTVALRILRSDFANFAKGDLALLALIAIAIIGVVVLWRRAESHLLVGAFVTTAAYNITNGTPTTFRYAMPGLIFYVVVVAALVAHAAQLARRSPGPWPRSAPPDEPVGQIVEPRPAPADLSPMLREHSSAPQLTPQSSVPSTPSSM